MKIVAALGGSALLQRGEKPDSAIQRLHVQAAVPAWRRWPRPIRLAAG